MYWALRLHTSQQDRWPGRRPRSRGAGRWEGQGSEPSICSPAVRRSPSALVQPGGVWESPRAELGAGGHQEVLASGPRRTQWTRMDCGVFATSFHDGVGPLDPLGGPRPAEAKQKALRGGGPHWDPSHPQPQHLRASAAAPAPQRLCRNPRGPWAPSRDRRIN